MLGLAAVKFAQGTRPGRAEALELAQAALRGDPGHVPAMLAICSFREWLSCL